VEEEKTQSGVSATERERVDATPDSERRRWQRRAGIVETGAKDEVKDTGVSGFEERNEDIEKEEKEAVEEAGADVHVQQRRKLSNLDVAVSEARCCFLRNAQFGAGGKWGVCYACSLKDKKQRWGCAEGHFQTQAHGQAVAWATRELEKLGVAGESVAATASAAATKSREVIAECGREVSTRKEEQSQEQQANPWAGMDANASSSSCSVNA
jgi:hypothetical protein